MLEVWMEQGLLWNQIVKAVKNTKKSIVIKKRDLNTVSIEVRDEDNSILDSVVVWDIATLADLECVLKDVLG